MSNSKLISDDMRAIITQILGGTDIIEVAKDRPEISMNKRTRMMVLSIVTAMHSENTVLRDWLNNTRAELSALKDPTIGELIYEEQNIRASILKYFGYDDDSEALSFFDFREYWWNCYEGEIRYSEFDKTLPADGENVNIEEYEAAWRGKDYTMLRVDFQSDMGYVLMLMKNTMEIAEVTD